VSARAIGLPFATHNPPFFDCWTHVLKSFAPLSGGAGVAAATADPSPPVVVSDRGTAVALSRLPAHQTPSGCTNEIIGDVGGAYRHVSASEAQALSGGSFPAQKGSSRAPAASAAAVPQRGEVPHGINAAVLHAAISGAGVEPEAGAATTGAPDARGRGSRKRSRDEAAAAPSSRVQVERSASSVGE
jgi:hypothetical protein